MVTMMSLWLPILGSAIAVFIVSSVIHSVLKYHRSDYGPIENEERVMAALREAGLQPGEYVMPYAGDMAAMKDPAYVERREKGPVAFMTVLRGGPVTMGAELAQWFLYCLFVSAFAAYVAGRALGPGAEYLEVFRFVGAAAVASYVFALWQFSIWYQRSWVTTAKWTFDGLVYALLTAGMFGWLWPA